MPNYLSRMKPNGANGTEYKLKDEELREAFDVFKEDIKGTQTATGNPITLTDASETYAQGLSVKLEPKQDLHGQSAPYVGGAGKNKLGISIATTKTENPGSWSGDKITVGGASVDFKSNGGYVTECVLNSTASDRFNITVSFTLKAGSYIYSSEFSEILYTTDTFLTLNDVAIARGNSSSPGQSFTLQEDATLKWILRIYDKANTNVVVKPMIRLATETDPTFAPYSNICPISGYEGVEVETADSASDPTQSRTASVTFGQTVYGGRSNFTEGGTDDDTKVTVLDGTVAPANSFVRNNTVCGCVLIADQKKYSVTHQTKVMCDSMPVFPPDYIYENDVFGVCENISSTSNGIWVSVYKDMLTSYDITGLQAWLTANNLQIAYERETNVDIATPKTDLKLLQDTNNLTTNGTTITLDYIPNNSIGDAVKASEEYTDRAVEGKADNTTAYVDLPGNYDTTNKNFPTRSATSGSVENCLTYINDIADKLYTAINSHATALANIPTKTVVVNHRAIDVGDEFNISLPLSYKFLIIELTIILTDELCYGSIVSTDFANGSVLSIVANGHGLSYWCDLSRMANRITVDGNFNSTHGELTITAF